MQEQSVPCPHFVWRWCPFEHVLLLPQSDRHQWIPCLQVQAPYAQSLYMTESILPSILHWVPELQGLGQFVVSHCDPVEAISERSTPDPEALVPALHYGGIVPQSQTVFPSMTKCFLHCPPWGVPVRCSLSPVAELSLLCCCHIVCAVALSSYFVVIWKVYSSQKLLFSVHRVQTLKLLWFPFTISKLPLLCVTEILKGVIVAETTPCTVMMVIWWM